MRDDFDLIEGLRVAANVECASYNVGDDTVRVCCGMLRDAANEIERLRKENQDLEDSLFNLGCEMKERT